MIDGQSLAARYAVLLPQFCQLVDDFLRSLQGLRAQEQEVTQQEDCQVALALECPLDADKVVRHVVGHIGMKILHCAEETFALPGSRRLNIPYGEYAQQWGTAPRAFDPQALWATLQKEYGGERGRESGYEEAAVTIIKTFRLRTGGSLPSRSGGLALSIDLYPKKDFHGGRHIPVDTVDELTELGHALNVFLAWAQQPIDATYTERWDFSRTLQSRERKCLVPGVLECITYRKRLEYRFAGELVEPLQGFLSQYGLDSWRTGNEVV